MQKFKKWLVGAIVVGTLVSATSSVLAYDQLKFKKNGGVDNEKYTITTGVSNWYGGLHTPWNTLTTDAVNSWNVSSSEIHYAKTTDKATSQLDYYNYDYGNNGYYGWCYSLLNSGTYVDPELRNWDWNKVSINAEYYYRTDWALQGTNAHEMGHALGLDHTDNNYTLMYWTGDGRKVNKPASDDIKGVNAKY